MDTRWVPKTSGLVVLSAALLVLGACDRPTAASSSAARPGPAANPSSPRPSTERAARTAPLPASEYFETLTEEAFGATPARLDAIILQASAAAARDRRGLSAAAAADLDGRLDQIALHRAAMNRTDLAIAAVEAYRLFVSAAPASAPVPVAVSLLDYAGFRFGADLQAQPVRWDDAAVAASFATDQWKQISDQVSDAALRDRFTAALTEMKAALDARDAARAARAGNRELDLVDDLEASFTPRR